MVAVAESRLQVAERIVGQVVGFNAAVWQGGTLVDCTWVVEWHCPDSRMAVS